MKPAPLTEEQERVKAESRTLVKILGMLDGLTPRTLGEIQDAVARRLMPTPPPMRPKTAEEEVNF